MATESEGSVVAMMIPEEVSLSQARAYVRSGNLNSYPSVSGVFLFRTQVCGNGAGISLGHEIELVGNPAAAFPLSSYLPNGTLGLSVLLGNVVGAAPHETPDLQPYFAPHPESVHAFKREHHHYVREYEGTTIHGEAPPTVMGLSCEWTFLGSKRVDLQFTSCVPERGLVLL